MSKLSLRSRFYAWLAEFCHRTTDWSIRQAYSRIHDFEDRNHQFGAMAYEKISEAYMREAMQHESCSLCRREGTLQADRTKKLAQRYRENDVEDFLKTQKASAATTESKDHAD